MTYYPPFYTDPAIGRGMSNLAQAFAPPDPAQQAQLQALQQERQIAMMEQAARSNLGQAYSQLYANPDGTINYEALNRVGLSVGQLGGSPGDIMPYLTAHNSLRADPQMAAAMGLANLNAQGVATGPDTATTVARQDEVASRNMRNSIAEAYGQQAAEAQYAQFDPSDFSQEDATAALDMALNTYVDDSGQPLRRTSRISSEDMARLTSMMPQLMAENRWTYNEAAQFISDQVVNRESRGHPGGGWFGFARGPNETFNITAPESVAPRGPAPQASALPPVEDRVVGQTTVSTPNGVMVWGVDENGNIGWLPDTRPRT